ncbi:hypothetical protein P4O66_017344 [Electrophorus voltai]|uniref:PDZ and LIM domain protein 2 n=1 Tax=Electrophorus voltai TaxID=2609070 RepID=A0AAD8YU52_9TELE|nr:hypothetical protein P4O66_017344 [Electrophorus voltai]
MAFPVNLKGPSPWGFRIAGGRDFKKAIMVSKVNSGSKAEKACLQPGDIILEINGENTADMLNVEAQNKIKSSNTHVKLLVERPATPSPGQTNGINPTEQLMGRFQEAVQVSRDENQNYRDYSISSPASLSPGPYSSEGDRITATSSKSLQFRSWSPEEKAPNRRLSRPLSQDFSPMDLRSNSVSSRTPTPPPGRYSPHSPTERDLSVSPRRSRARFSETDLALRRPKGATGSLGAFSWQDIRREKSLMAHRLLSSNPARPVELAVLGPVPPGYCRTSLPVGQLFLSGLTCSRSLARSLILFLSLSLSISAYVIRLSFTRRSFTHIPKHACKRTQVCQRQSLARPVPRGVRHTHTHPASISLFLQPGQGNSIKCNDEAGRRAPVPLRPGPLDPGLRRNQKKVRGLRIPLQRGLKQAGSDFAMQRFDRESEVYKMIQENKESRSAPRQSSTFKMLQEVLEADEKDASVKLPSKLSPNPPKPVTSVAGVSKFHNCEKCGNSIVTQAVRIMDERFRHPECYTCTECGLNLKMRGHFWVDNEMFCEKHARERYQGPGAGYRHPISPHY